MDLTRAFLLATCFAWIFAALIAKADLNVPAAVPRMVRVVVIDTGLPPNFTGPICTKGSYDFTGTGLQDTYFHGTYVAGAILEEAQTNRGWCLIMLKFADPRTSPTARVINYIRALHYAQSLDFQILNLSVSGPAPILRERTYLKALLDRGIKVQVAAGNEGIDLNLNCNVYPACLDSRLTVVGVPETYSNFGAQVDFKLAGKWGPKVRGTSIAAGRATGQLVRRLVGAPLN